MKLKSWPAFWLQVKLFLFEILCGHYLELFSLLSFFISKIVFTSRNCVAVFSIPVVLQLSCGEVIWFFFSLEMDFKKSAQMDWDKLVTWIMRGGRMCPVDFYPGVIKLGEFEKGQLHWASLNSPCKISIQYFFSMSYCL